MLTVKFSKTYCTKKTVPTLSLEQQRPVLQTVCNISLLSTILELYSEITLFRKPVGIGYMYTYTCLLRMANNMTYQDSELFPWDTLYNGQKYTDFMHEMCTVALLIK
jgi:hypothetical protein